MKRMGEWGALLLLLAVPAGIFMYWQKTSAVKRKAALPPPAPAASAQMFSQGSAAETGRKEAETAVTVAAAPAAGAAVPTVDAPSSAPAAAPEAAPPAAEAEGSGPTAPGLFAPKTERDPMESVGDRMAIAHYNEMMEREADASKRATQTPIRTGPPKKRQPKLEDRIVLQGVMEVQGRITAIVNGEMVSKGQKVLGATVVKITENSVVFQEKGNKFFTKRIKERKK